MLNTNVYSIISQYLCFFDRIKLKLTNKYAFNCVKLNFKDDFCKKMSNIVDNPFEFCEQMKINNTYVSGSFILDVIYNTDCAGDIDIYEGDDKCTEYYDCDFRLDNIKYSNRLKFLQYMYTLDLDNFSNGTKSDFTSYNGPIYLIRNYKTKKSNTQIQHIVVRSKNVDKFIENSFDLDICKNYFDGEKLKIGYLDKILTKKDYIRPLSLLMEFYVDMNDGDNNNQHTLTYERMKKYIDRGFDIKKHPNFDKIYKHIKQLAIEFYFDWRCSRDRRCDGDKFNIIMDGFYMN